jgi:hypothetical protein
MPATGTYILIRRDRQDFFVPTTGYITDNEPPIVRSRYPRFVDLLDAMEYADQQNTEYGITIEEECYDETPTHLSTVGNTNHYYGCSQASPDEEVREVYKECICDRIADEWNENYTPES